ncbi:MAG TPA: hypothetical protein VMN38_00340 [Sphingomicrobium sp.]|nr:hypothetical protein [Sphingomicrobium sp.]
MDRISDRERRIVIRWRTRGQLQALRPALGSVNPSNEAGSSAEALKAIDEAERQVWGDRATEDGPPE